MFIKLLARSQVDQFSSTANEKKVIVLNAPERIRKIDGNSYCADCSAPSKYRILTMFIGFSCVMGGR